MARKKNKDKVLNDRPRKVFRKYIGKNEIAFSVFFIVFTAAMGVWFVVQKDNYDPTERDISMEVMIAQQVEDHLWEPPLERWVEPGTRTGGGAPAFDLGVFPASTIVGGWDPSSRVEVFDGTNVYEKINGQETQYKAYGFQFLHFVAIENREAGLEINIELYDMGSFQNALGIFAAQRSAGSQVEREGNTFLYRTQAGALGIVDKFYFKFTGNEDSDVIRSHAVKVATDFADGMAESGATPRAFMILAGDLEVDFSGIEYIKEDVFQYDFAKDFWFGAVGDSPEFKYYLHETESEAAAAELFGLIQEEHSFDYTVLSSDDASAAMKHDFLDTIFTLNHSGRFVFGIDGAPDEEQADAAQRALASVLTEGPA